jgi:hypothetical protein
MLTLRPTLIALSLGLSLGAVTAGNTALAEEAKKDAPAAAPAPPSTVESNIERRREAMERRRDDYRDARTGRYWRQPPWVTGREAWAERQHDARNEAYRQRRDTSELRHDQWGRWAHPWLQWERDWDEARRNAWDLNRLYREEMADRRFYSRPWGPPGGYGW